MVVSGILLLTLSGCVRVDAALTVHRNDTVTGVFTLAVSKQLLALAGQSPDQVFDPAKVFPGTTMAKVEPFDDGTNVGRTYTTTPVPLANFNEGVDKQGTLTITHTRGKYEFSGTMANPSEGQSAEAAAALSSGTWKISVTFPGPVLTSNGTVQGRTVTWTGGFNQGAQMAATASDFPFTPVMTAVYGGCVLAVLVIVTCLVILARRRRAQARAWFPAPAPVSVASRFTGPTAYSPQPLPAPQPYTPPPAVRGTYGWDPGNPTGQPRGDEPPPTPQGWYGPPPGGGSTPHGW